MGEKKKANRKNKINLKRRYKYGGGRPENGIVSGKNLFWKTEPFGKIKVFYLGGNKLKKIRVSKRGPW